VFKGYWTFCEAPAWSSAAHKRPFCVPDGPSLYAHVQATYWGVGFLKYYRLKQLPNFALAAPVILLAALSALEFVKAQPRVAATVGGLLPKPFAPFPLRKQCKDLTGFHSPSMFIFVAQMTAMLVFGILFMHVQVRTASPAFWQLALVTC
jgi:GPI mannosyltransferase 2